MKSERANEFIDGAMKHIVANLSEHGKWQLRTAMNHAAELAEQEAEERMRTKVHKIIKEMMTGIFKGDMPQKIADELIQKLTNDETD